MSDTILQMKNIRKSFSGVNALVNVDLSVERGEIHGIVGENGCGKTTLMKVLCGVYPYGTYSGDIIYNGKPCRFRNLKSSERAGIVIIHQELSLIPHMSVAENIFLGNERKNSLGLIDWEQTYSDAAGIMKEIGLNEDPRSPVYSIGAGKRQMTEIAKALSKNVKLLILDEPTSSLTEDESMRLMDLLKDFREQGITSIIISHKLNEIAYAADRITVLRDGETIETIDNSTHMIDEDRIIQCMVGRKLTKRYPQREGGKTDETALELKDYTVRSTAGKEEVILDSVSLSAAKGEIVGIFGLQGAGRTRLLMSMFGSLPNVRVSGDMLLYGKKCSFSSPTEAIKEGMVYVTEDRALNGMLPGNSLVNNTTLAAISKVSGRFAVDREKEITITDSYVKSMDIKAGSVMQNAAFLSGGNQQKLLLSRWLFTEPKLILLDEPTRGIDVAAQYDIYKLINELADSGKTVVMVSSVMAELLGMCTRIYVMNEGRVVGEFDSRDATQEKIMKAIIRSQDKGA